MNRMKSLFLLALCLGVAIADPFGLDLDDPLPLPCDKSTCEQAEYTACKGLNAYAAYADSCGPSGGHALFSDFGAARPIGFGESRWLFDVQGGATTGRVEFYGTTDGSYARVYGSLSGVSDKNNKWDLIVELVKIPKSQVNGTKVELYQNCPLANVKQLQASWLYYKMRSDKPSMLVGRGINAGCNITIGFDRDHMYVGQVGKGASQKNVRFGFTGWISYLSFSYDDTWTPSERFDFRNLNTRMKDGDININAECPCQCDIPPPPEGECGNNIVETGEDCDGGECCNKDCTYKNSTTVCRPQNGDCDVPETCTGSSATCPSDAYAPDTQECQELVGFCDVRIHNTCPGDAPVCHGPSSIAIDQGLTPWESFNVISFHNFVAFTGDVEGRLAVRDDFIITEGFSIGYKTDTTPTGSDRFVPAALVVGHVADWIKGGSVWPDGTGVPNQSNEEGIFVGEDYSSLPSYLKSRVIGTSTFVGDKDQEFDDAKDFYTELQGKFSARTANAQATVKYGGLFITCDDISDTFYVVDIDGADLSAINWFNLDNCNFQANWVINVGGSGDVTFAGGRFPAIVERVVFNIEGTGRTLQLTTEIAGNLLAPTHTFNQTNGVTKGLVIVGDVISFIQSDRPICTKFEDVVVSTRTTERIQGFQTPSRSIDGANGDLIQVPNFSNFAIGDVIKIGGEQVTIIRGVQDDQGHFYFQVSPPLMGSYDAGTEVTTVVKNPGNAVREPITVSPFVPQTYDENESNAAALTIGVASVVAAVSASLF